MQQWGVVASGTSGTVTFPIAFPSACRVVLTQDEDGTTSNAGPIFVAVRSATQFTWLAAAERGAWTWFAIGN